MKLTVALFLLACATRTRRPGPGDKLRIRRGDAHPGIAWILIQPGRTDRVVILGDDVSLDTPMRWGSITKTFAALTLMQVAEQAGVPLTTPVVNALDTGLTGHTLPESMRLENLITLSAGHTDLGREAFADNTLTAARCSGNGTEMR
ncbi:MAG: serine hydrolase [Pseudomonadales bacterium]